MRVIYECMPPVGSGNCAYTYRNGRAQTTGAKPEEAGARGVGGDEVQVDGGRCLSAAFAGQVCGTANVAGGPLVADIADGTYGDFSVAIDVLEPGGNQALPSSFVFSAGNGTMPGKMS